MDDDKSWTTIARQVLKYKEAFCCCSSPSLQLPNQTHNKPKHKLIFFIKMSGLTQDQINAFNRDGCLVIPNELAPATITALLAQSHHLLDTFPLADHPLTQFTTGDNVGAHVGDQYFLESADKVHFFFEEGAIKDGALVKPKSKAINKIGHLLHEADPVFKDVSLTARNAQIARDLGLKDPRILQSMMICKQPEIGGEVPPHQDAVFLYTDPLSCLGFWYALEDCTAENGALEYVPGSHLTSPIAKRFVRTPDASVPGTGASGTHFEPIPGVTAAAEPSKEEYRLVDCPAGSLVLIHHSVVHRSKANLSDKSRYAYAFHAVDGECEYDGKNWLQIPVSGGCEFTRLGGEAQAQAEPVAA